MHTVLPSLSSTGESSLELPDLQASGEPLSMGPRSGRPHEFHPSIRLDGAAFPSEPLTTGPRPLTSFPPSFQDKITTAEEALKLVSSGDRVYIGGGCGEPLKLAESLVLRKDDLRNVEIIHVLTAGHAPYATSR
jgi:hypothetical protein